MSRVSGECACFGCKIVLHVYDDDLGPGLVQVNGVEMEGVIRTVKERCGKCRRVYLSHFTFPLNYDA